ncbi:MAG: hypothetical protein DI573_13815, partial [Microbacterium sp.]|uniref:Gfo/Idh/MocA family protein n=1 Tax=Microbacterium sp. TaxID=51671 RepID=UPI000DB880B4
HHIPALNRDPRAAVAVVVDADPVRRTLVTDTFHLPTADDFHDAISTQHLDGLLIATPHSAHAPLAVAALRAGIPVLVEKPLTLSSGDAQILADLVDRTGVPLMVGYTAQFTEAARLACEWVQHEIGALHQVIVEFSSRAGARYSQTDPADASSAYSAANGSGQATTQLSHAFGAITSATDRAFTEVAAFTANRGAAVDIDDVVAFRLEGGATGTAASTGTLPAGLPMRHQVRYIGAEGIVEHDLLWSTARMDGLDGRIRAHRPTHIEPPYAAAAPVTAFLSLLEGAGGNPAPVRPAAAAVAAIEALLRSAHTGRAEPVPTITH